MAVGKTLMEGAKPDEARQDEFVRLTSIHSQRVYQFILMLGIRGADADEVFQDTCLVLWNKFDSYESTGNFYAWACKIAYLKILERRRANRRLHLFSADVLGVLADKAMTHADELEVRREALNECLERLNEKDRELIEQRYYFRSTPKEIATKESRSVYSIYRALCRIHNKLFECVEARLKEEMS
jgi:RNA polymerase sigma-70 factor, ECF subfamily